MTHSVRFLPANFTIRSLKLVYCLIRNFSESNIKKENDETDQEMMAVCQREFDTYGKFIDTFEQSNLVTKNSIDYFTYLIRTKQNNYLIHDSVDIGSNFYYKLVINCPSPKPM